MHFNGERRKFVISYEKCKYACLKTAEKYCGDNIMMQHNSTGMFVAYYLK